MAVDSIEVTRDLCVIATSFGVFHVVSVIVSRVFLSFKSQIVSSKPPNNTTAQGRRLVINIGGGKNLGHKYWGAKMGKRNRGGKKFFWKKFFKKKIWKNSLKFSKKKFEKIFFFFLVIENFF